MKITTILGSPSKYVVPQCTKPSELGDKGEKTARQMRADLLGAD